MAFNWHDLSAMDRDTLIGHHDSMAPNTVVGIQYFLDEIRRRDAAEASASSLRLATAGIWLALANTLLAVVAVVIAVLK